MILLQAAAPEAPSTAKQFLESVAFVLIQPSSVLGIVVNAVAIHFMKLVLDSEKGPENTPQAHHASQPET